MSKFCEDLRIDVPPSNRAKVQELATFRRRPRETAQMAYHRTRQLNDDTKTFSERELTERFIYACPENLRYMIYSNLYTTFPSDHKFQLIEAYQAAERVEMHNQYTEVYTSKMIAPANASSSKGKEIRYVAPIPPHKNVRRAAMASSAIPNNNNRFKGPMLDCKVTNTVQGNCYICGRKGHMQSNCPLVKVGNIRCRNRGATSHVKSGCWKAHPELAPAFTKPRAQNNGPPFQRRVAHLRSQDPTPSNKFESQISSLVTHLKQLTTAQKQDKDSSSGA
jgi:Zinc knuckle